MQNGHKVSAESAVRLACRGSRIYVAGCLGEPSAVLDVASADPDLWQDMRITGVHVPGVNERDLSAIGRRTTVETIFATAGLRPRRSSGRVELMPLHYSTYEAWVRSAGTIDIAYFNVTKPRGDGTVGLGPSADFTPSVLAGGAGAVGIINTNLPDVPDGPRYPLDRFEAFVESGAAMVGYDAGEPDAPTEAIAELIRAQIGAGDTIQLGLGKLQTAVLRRLEGMRGLGFHGGMLSGAFIEANRSGAFELGVTSGVALGHADFLAEVARQPNVRFRPVSFTHAAGVLANIPNLVSINSVLEIDLYGQANAEFMGDIQVSGHGGMVDFVRGARASAGGRSILALPSAARDGSVSRIVPSLSSTNPISVARSDIDLVATEHGIVNLRNMGTEGRAEALISIAAPQFRDRLATAWHGRHKTNQHGRAG
ncbi:acetyl-CoA hydrolase/transferase family protein [Mesorhizobium yinganensis]|uniref:acetyl-CoA hydrolase/transferase family protein n=1 Tax=Mesorhizobium yinganensis TaxID=3157707 RepID=UPI0032B7C770